MRFAIILVAACGSPMSSTPMTGDDGGKSDGITVDAPMPTPLALPPPNATFDYQLGGAYAKTVQVISRDRNAAPASGIYNICYVNGFQVQPDEESLWDPDLILRNAQGQPIIDPDWNEMLLDVSATKRARIAVVVDGWIAKCHSDGFDAVEIDNLDSYTRSGGRLHEADAVAMMVAFSQSAHSRGMAVAQKNSTDLLDRKADMHTDFAVAEECNHYTECGDYTAVYGDHVIVIEYVRADFMKGCTQFPQLSIVLRDRDLVTPSSAAYVYDGC